MVLFEIEFVLLALALALAFASASRARLARLDSDGARIGELTPLSRSPRSLRSLLSPRSLRSPLARLAPSEEERGGSEVTDFLRLEDSLRVRIPETLPDFSSLSGRSEGAGETDGRSDASRSVAWKAACVDGSETLRGMEGRTGSRSLLYVERRGWKGASCAGPLPVGASAFGSPTDWPGVGEWAGMVASGGSIGGVKLSEVGVVVRSGWIGGSEGNRSGLVGSVGGELDEGWLELDE